ncbi:uncharacterized protein LOC115716957 [Cannabis sativa]|uniref:uncharacterized protein LOC115716957 n=1 Tax=Cannabis sativa TaxID=3483 RepID=UPI0029CA1FA3|nr:uncharacterized protein LOC115716957 [Cannabis sativa]
MGIPSFYRWLVEKFPRTVIDAPINGLDFDNLYLDMNGIIHPCFHPQGLPAPKTYDEVFQAVFKYIDKLLSVAKPKKLLFLAIDGVAPRAKMNQQRSRRFRTAKDAAEEAAWKVKLKNQSIEDSCKLDSNVITPGSEFMALLSSALRYYIYLRMNEDPNWQGIKVILSDASVPGEGEHKIMSYIRLQRNLPGFDPNTRHCLYGLDADLIMLALASHEVHFSILREDVMKDKFVKSKYMNKRNGTGLLKGNLDSYISNQKFQFLHIWILREYLAYLMEIPDVKGDLERQIDDFVLMCLFVGNDFLPHIPSLEISEGAIELLLTIYKMEFVTMGGYLTNSFEVNLERMKHFLGVVGSYEGLILQKRVQVENEWAIRDQRYSQNKTVTETSLGSKSVNSSAMMKQAPDNTTSVSTSTEVKKINFGENDWKEKYYLEKFKVETENDRLNVRNDLVLKYTEGICWVMHYYYEGVCSWQWYYPYHYAPCASDFVGIDELKIQFTLGVPFKPFDQLMAVLPAASAHALPVSYRKLMTDASSPLLAFYPTDVELDMNGKRFSWQAIYKLPFIEETILLSEIARVENELTEEERQRNKLGMDVLFVHVTYPLAMNILSFYRSNVDHLSLIDTQIKQEIVPESSDGMNGYIFVSNIPVQPEQIYSPIDGMDMIADNKVLSVFYNSPAFHAHIPRAPNGVHYPKKSIFRRHVKPTPFLWHEKSSVVGRLHSLRPIHMSISGSRLSNSARLLVTKWYLEIEKQRKSKGDVELHGAKTTDGSHAAAEGESINGKTMKRIARARRQKEKRARRQKEKRMAELGAMHVGEKGPASIPMTQEAVSVDAGLVESAIVDVSHAAAEGESINGKTIDGSHAAAEGESINGKTVKRIARARRQKEKRARRQKEKRMAELGDMHVGEKGPASIPMTQEAVSVDAGLVESAIVDVNIGKSGREQNDIIHVGKKEPASTPETQEAVFIDASCGESATVDAKCKSDIIHVGEKEAASTPKTQEEALSIEASLGETATVDAGVDSKGINCKTRKRRRKHESGREQSGIIHAGKKEPASTPKTEEAVFIDAGCGESATVDGKRESDIIHLGEKEAASTPKTQEETLSIDAGLGESAGAESKGIDNSKTKKRRRKSKSGRGQSDIIHVGEKEPASTPKTEEAVFIDAGCGESATVDGQCKSYIIHLGEKEAASTPKTQEETLSIDAGLGESAGAEIKGINDGKTRKRRRKSKSGREQSDTIHVGEKEPASTPKTETAVFIDAGCGESATVDGKLESDIIHLGEKEAASTPKTREETLSINAGLGEIAGAESKGIDNGKTRKRRRKSESGRGQSDIIHVGEKEPASAPKTETAVFIDAGCGESATVDGKRESDIIHLGEKEAASTPKTQEETLSIDAGLGESAGAEIKGINDGKTRKRRRKSKSGREQSDTIHVGEKESASSPKTETAVSIDAGLEKEPASNPNIGEPAMISNTGERTTSGGDNR